ncbi:hypothetical protein ABPG72_020155 [Tetrahymena utriculariae]
MHSIALKQQLANMEQNMPISFQLLAKQSISLLIASNKAQDIFTAGNSWVFITEKSSQILYRLEEATERSLAYKALTIENENAQISSLKHCLSVHYQEALTNAEFVSSLYKTQHKNGVCKIFGLDIFMFELVSQLIN